MKVLTVSATDRFGGAGIAAYRLHRGLSRSGIEAEMLVWRKVTSDHSVHRLASRLSRWERVQRRLAERGHRRQLQANPRREGSSYWSLNLNSYPIAAVINDFAADIVHLHWLGDNFLPISQVAQIQAPVVWTLHDMWAFTGGCHYSGECGRYSVGCGNCPHLSQSADDDISARVNKEKRRAWVDVPLAVVCPSKWLAECARGSAVLKGKRIEVIANPIDPCEFKPLAKEEARRAFNLPQDKKLVLFGAVGGTADARKGFVYLQEALRHIAGDSGVELVVFGAESEESISVEVPLHQMGILRDSVSLSLLYSACDAFVLPALQDNLPNTLLEALACGAPCVAFDTGGMGELVQHQKNGYLAKLMDAGDLLRGIEWTLAQEWSAERIHQGVVESFAAQRISDRYIRHYQSILDRVL